MSETFIFILFFSLDSSFIILYVYLILIFIQGLEEQSFPTERATLIKEGL